MRYTASYFCVMVPADTLPYDVCGLNDDTGTVYTHSSAHRDPIRTAHRKYIWNHLSDVDSDMVCDVKYFFVEGCSLSIY